MPNFISEDQIERALVQKLQHLHGFDSLDCHTEDPEDLNDGSGRASKRDVILVDRVREAAIRLNPKIPAKAIEDALEKLLDRRQAMSLVAANRRAVIASSVARRNAKSSGSGLVQRWAIQIARPIRRRERVAYPSAGQLRPHRLHGKVQQRV